MNRYLIAAMLLLSLLVGTTLVSSPMAAQASRELIRNGDFVGVSEWSFGGECAIWRLGSEGLEEWIEVLVPRCGGNIQVAQRDLALQPNSSYRLEFSGASSSGHDLAVVLNMQQEPYSSLGLDAVCDLREGGTGETMAWQECTVDFETSGEQDVSDSGVLRFWLTRFARADDTYRIDKVRLVETDQPGDVNVCICR